MFQRTTPELPYCWPVCLRAAMANRKSDPRFWQEEHDARDHFQSLPLPQTTAASCEFDRLSMTERRGADGSRRSVPTCVCRGCGGQAHDRIREYPCAPAFAQAAAGKSVAKILCLCVLVVKEVRSWEATQCSKMAFPRRDSRELEAGQAWTWSKF